MEHQQKPLILYALPPREGHMRPALQIAAHLVARGFDVTLLADAAWAPAVRAIGASTSPVIGLWATLGDVERWLDIAEAPTAAERLRNSLADGFVMLLPSGLESVRNALNEMRHRLEGQQQQQQGLAGRTVVILSDTTFSGTLALRLDTDLPQGYEHDNVSIKTLGIGLVPRFWAAPERPPWGSGLPYDVSEDGIRRTLAAHAEVFDVEAEERARFVLSMLNCRKMPEDLYAKYHVNDGNSLLLQGLKRPFWDATTVCHDVVLQMGLPSFEYPAPSDPPHLKFAGALPLKPVPDDLVYPDWFATDVLPHSAAASSSSKPGNDRKRIVLVAQGTETPDQRELLVPTIQGLAGRSDVLVIAILCVKGAVIDEHLVHFDGGVLPSNVRVIDYFPYDAVLPHADLFVSNSVSGLSFFFLSSQPD